MVRDVEFAVTAADKVGNGLASAEAKFSATQARIKRDSDKASDSLAKMGNAGTQSVTKLRKELEVAEGDLKKLATAFANAGSASERIDISKSMRKQKATIRELENAIKGIGEQVPEVGSLIGSKLVYGAIAAAPLLGATISAAVIGGASIGGVIGGAYLAARDPRVKQAGTELGKNLLSSLEQDAQPFVQPVLDNIEKVEIRFSLMDTRIKSIFSHSSGYLDPLVDGLLDGVDGILRGVDALVAKGGPVIEAFGRLFGKTGDAIGDAFEIISGGSDDAAKAVDDLTAFLQVLIISAGVAVRTLTWLYGAITYIPRTLHEFSNQLAGVEETTKATASTTAVLTTVQRTAGAVILSAGEAAGQAGLNMYTYAQRMDDAATKGRSLYDSQTAVADALARAKKALDDNGKTLDINSQKGRDNRNVLSAYAGTLNSTYQAFVKVNGEGVASARIADNNRAAFVRLATQFTGSKAKAEALANQLGVLAKPRTADVHVNTHDSEARAAALNSKLNNAARNRTASVTVVINSGRLSSIENRLNRLGGSLYNAAGATWAALDSNSGTVRAGGPTPVALSNEVTVSLDGQPFYSYTAMAVSASERRQYWRAKVGAR